MLERKLRPKCSGLKVQNKGKKNRIRWIGLRSRKKKMKTIKIGNDQATDKIDGKKGENIFK